MPVTICVCAASTSNPAAKLLGTATASGPRWRTSASASRPERPALIYVVSGTITEYSSHCQVPIVHKTGELSVEQGGLSHWWKNTSKKPVVLISADIAQDPEQHGM